MKLETGAADPTEDHVDALCKYFGVEKDELLNKNLGWDISRKLSVRRMMESKINFAIVIVCLGDLGFYCFAAHTADNVIF